MFLVTPIYYRDFSCNDQLAILLETVADLGDNRTHIRERNQFLNSRNYDFLYRKLLDIAKGFETIFQDIVQAFKCML